jgi:hypothetical protein
MQATTTGKNVFKEEEKAMAKYSTQWKQMKYATANAVLNTRGTDITSWTNLVE